MQGVPEGLIWVLIFGAVLLLQFLLKRFVPQPQSPSSPQEQADQEFLAQERPPAEIAPEWTVPESRISRSQAAAASLARAGRRPRRYSRSALLGTQRAVQNAMVVTTILGPCRALAPHDAAP
ncbi:MAG: hypothetical protein Q8L49_11230 [Burkholderiaceae bacterium]|nr:hypothetical protein [Burkholderiaceae bacterium]